MYYLLGHAKFHCIRDNKNYIIFLFQVLIYELFSGAGMTFMARRIVEVSYFSSCDIRCIEGGINER